MPKGIPRQTEIRAIRRAFRVIERALVRVAEAAAHPTRDIKSSGTRGQLRLTPKRRAALKLQGRYMGYMRQLKPRQKAKIRNLRERNGYSAAIRLAKELVSR
ncbi:MAG TPA: hypothetical protein VFV19_18765 [Candidatus Polarisedimenticolaceae bacterium]|nr:hypothetical protein [Candidatus Polarisedimenticolaceae bacterium]